jgi:hypothetical protein
VRTIASITRATLPRLRYGSLRVPGLRKTVGYCRVSTNAQADRGISLDAQADKIRAMATVQSAELVDVIVDGGESGKSLQRPGLQRLVAMIDRRDVQLVIIAKLDRLTRRVRDLRELLEKFERRGVALVSVGESLDTGSAAGRLVLNVMAFGQPVGAGGLLLSGHGTLCGTSGLSASALATCRTATPSALMAPP